MLQLLLGASLLDGCSAAPCCMLVTDAGVEAGGAAAAPDAGMAGLKQLRTLLLGHNQLQQLPEDLGALPMLEHLDLSNNHIGWGALPCACTAHCPLPARATLRWPPLGFGCHCSSAPMALPH
jgi:hypothetical protein